MRRCGMDEVQVKYARDLVAVSHAVCTLAALTQYCSVAQPRAGNKHEASSLLAKDGTAQVTW
jgi:hypothetical protein